MKKAGKIILWILVGFVLIQFIPVNKANPSVKKTQNFIDVKKTPAKEAQLLKNACYDCHSNETIYPKYAYIAPFSWSVKSHINDGREHLNFSIWETYNQDLKEGMLKKSAQTIENKTMPMPVYIIYHPEANLSDAERTLLQKYFEKLLKSEDY